MDSICEAELAGWNRIYDGRAWFRQQGKTSELRGACVVCGGLSERKLTPGADYIDVGLDKPWRARVTFEVCEADTAYARSVFLEAWGSTD